MTIDLLLVEDEASVREMIVFALADTGWRIREAADATKALEAIRGQRPDLVLLDWMLPGMSGVDLVRVLRREAVTKEIPVIMLTARTAEDDRVDGLDAGADDYICKPFSPRELRARITALMRRLGRVDTNGVLQAGALRLDADGHEVTLDGRSLELGPTEFRILHFFMSHPERAYTREQMLDNIWGRNVFIEERTIDVHIRRLRKVLEPFGYASCIQTVRTVGYRFSLRGLAAAEDRG